MLIENEKKFINLLDIHIIWLPVGNGTKRRDRIA